MNKRCFVFGFLCFVLNFTGVVLAAGRQPLMSDGLLLLHGTLQDVKTNESGLSFRFTGKLSFTFFTAARQEQGRTNVDLKFDVTNVPVTVPKFGRPQDNTNAAPTIVNYPNAIKHALHAAKTGQPVSIVLFRPKMSFTINGLIEELECHHAQIQPERR